MQEILIETIRTDGAVQSRAAINPEYVADLAELIKSGVKLPPVDLFREAAGECWMADGFHRLRAHEAAGALTIRANVHKGGKAEAVWHSCGSNKEHGLRRNKGDIERAINMAIGLRPSSSTRLIAEHVGCGHPWVVQVVGSNHLTRPDKVVGRDGKEYPSRRPPPPPPPRPPSEPTALRLVEPDETPRREQVALKRTDQLDVLGRPIPDHLTDLFRRGGEVRELLGYLSRVRGAVRAAADDQLYSECNRDAVEAACAQAYADLKATIPHAVCPWCGGNDPMQSSCRGCGGRGAIGEFRWDNAVPAELKGRERGR